MGNGVRQICLLLIPSAVLMAVLAEPITRLVYQRGEFDAEATELESTAMVWWSISLPFQGVSLLFSRTFFSLQQPWATTALGGPEPGGERASQPRCTAVRHRRIVIGTVVGTVAMASRRGWMLRRELGGMEGAGCWASGVRMLAGRGAARGLRHTASGSCSTGALGRSLTGRLRVP